MVCLQDAKRKEAFLYIPHRWISSLVKVKHFSAAKHSSYLLTGSAGRGLVIKTEGSPAVLTVIYLRRLGSDSALPPIWYGNGFDSPSQMK